MCHENKIAKKQSIWLGVGGVRLKKTEADQNAGAVMWKISNGTDSWRQNIEVGDHQDEFLAKWHNLLGRILL